MSRGRVIQNAFTSGELSPKLMGRTDLEAYAHGCRTIENAVVFKQGGATRRPGLRFVKETRTSANVWGLMRFRDSRGPHVLALGGDGKGEFYSDGAEESSGLGYHVEHTYTDAEIPDVRYAQINDLGFGDMMILTHPDHAPFMIYWTGSVYAYAEIPAWDGPYLPANTTATTLAMSTASAGASGTLTASAATFVTGASGHVGALFQLTVSGVTGFVRVTAVASTTSATATVVKTLGGTGTTATWREGAWSPYRGYPRDVTTYQQRVIFARTSSQRNYIWGTQTGQLYNSANAILGWSRWLNMDAGTALDNEAITFQVQGVEDIQWVSGGKSLVVGGIEAVEALDGGSDSIMAPANPPIARRTAFGCSGVAPVPVHNGLIFAQRSGAVLREHTFDYQSDAYAAADLTALSDHILGDGVVQLDYEQGPRSTVWAVLSDGTMAGMTYEKDNNVIAWHRHETDGLIESAVSVTGDEGTEETLWVIVKRTINGATVRYVEYFDDTGGHYGPLQTDSAVVYTATAAMTGLSHLEGETVDVLVGGVSYPAQTVASGVITRPADGVAEVGLAFDSTVVPVRPEWRTFSGSGQGARQRFSKVWVRLYQSAGVTINGNLVTARRGDAGFGDVAPLLTGDYDVVNTGWAVGADITIAQTNPLPMTVLAVIGVLNQED